MKIAENENQYTRSTPPSSDLFVILRCKVLVSWFFWLFENAGKLARGIFCGLQGLQGGRMVHFLGLQGLQGGGMVHFWGLHELQVKKKGAFLSFHGVQTSCEGPFWSFHGVQTSCEGPFPLFARAANLLRWSFFQGGRKLQLGKQEKVRFFSLFTSSRKGGNLGAFL